MNTSRANRPDSGIPLPDCFQPVKGIETSLYGVGRFTWHKLASIFSINVLAISLSAVNIENDNPYFPRLENLIADSILLVL